MIDQDLFQLLQARAVIDTHGVNDKPRRRHCLACGLVVWAAWRNGTGATVIVDDVVLTPKGEFDALMAGRETFEHWPGGLDMRTPDMIRKFPADGDFAHRVRPFHVCHAPPLDSFGSHDTREPDDPDHPPF
jgi:hypothetical protein